jgi:hypothetical protein
MQHRVFFPQAALDQWTVDGKVDVAGSELHIVGEGRTYDVAEAVYVVKEVTGGSDPNQLLGKVKPKSALTELGAELLEGSMILGDAAYDVVQGWMGTPQGSFETHLKSSERATARSRADAPGPDPQSEEDLLLSLLRN